MFQAWLVNSAKMQASSAPNTLPGASDRKNTTVTDRNPRIGTDCRMSRIGISTSPARRLFAAAVVLDPARQLRGLFRHAAAPQRDHDPLLRARAAVGKGDAARSGGGAHFFPLDYFVAQPIGIEHRVIAAQQFGHGPDGLPFRPANDLELDG